MNERIKELDEELKRRRLIVEDHCMIDGRRVDEETMRLMELRMSHELAFQIECLQRAVTRLAVWAKP
jgi:hypothetical protein